MVPEAVLPSASESWQVSSLEKDKSLNAGSCSLKAKDFGVSGGPKQRGCCCSLHDTGLRVKG